MLTLRRAVAAIGTAAVVATGSYLAPASADDPNTTTTVSGSPSTTAHGEKVTLTATVARNDGSAVVPVGQVAFSVDGQSLGTKPLTKGKAVLKTGALPIGDDTVTATYLGGSGDSQSSSGTTEQEVYAPTTMTTVSPSNGAFLYGTPLAAKVAVVGPGTGPLAGTMSWYDDQGDPFATTTVSNGRSTLPGNALEPGSYPNLRALFHSSDGSVADSEYDFGLAVTKGSTSTTLVSSANPSAQGQPVTFTATVRRPDSKVALDGPVTFHLGDQEVSVAPNSKWVAKYTTSTLPPGITTVSAVYESSPHFNGSGTSLDQQVNGATAD